MNTKWSSTEMTARKFPLERKSPIINPLFEEAHWVTVQIQIKETKNWIKSYFDYIYIKINSIVFYMFIPSRLEDCNSTFFISNYFQGSSFLEL